jgi:hypothetical protein
MQFAGAATGLTTLLLVSFGLYVFGAAVVELQRDSQSPFPASKANTHAEWFAKSSAVATHFLPSGLSREFGDKESTAMWKGHPENHNGSIASPWLNPGSRFDREAARQALIQSLQLTPDQRRALAQLTQGSPEWKDARRHRCAFSPAAPPCSPPAPRAQRPRAAMTSSHDVRARAPAPRLTGSNFGAAVGHNRFKSPAQLVHDMLYGDFDGNDATRWGSAHEALACHEYATARRALLDRGGGGGGGGRFEVTHSGLSVAEDRPWLAVSPDGHVREGDEEGVVEIKCPFSRRVYQAIPPYYMDQVRRGRKR